MIRVVTTLFLPGFLFFAHSIFGQSAGLVAAYSFNEGTGAAVADASGNANSGTIVNATWAATGKFSKALVFNGTSAMVTVNHSASLNLTSGMTLEAWVNPSTIRSAWGDVVYKADDVFYLEATSPNGSRPAGGTLAGSNHLDTYGPLALAPNTWTHLALTYDGAALRLYVNGAQVSSVPRTGNLMLSSSPLSIGGNSIYGQYFAGMIDEVRVYNVALTATQIQADMSAPITVSSAPIQMSALNACDLDADGVVNNDDVLLAVNMTLQKVTPCTANVSGPGVCNVGVVQKIVNNSLGGPCSTVTIPPPVHTVTLNWGASPSAGVIGYDVYRRTISGSYALLTTASRVAATTYVDSTVQAGGTYYYVVRAVNSSNQSSANSNEAIANIPSP